MISIYVVKFYLFVFDCADFLFSLVVESGGYSLAAARGLLVSEACLGERGLLGAQASAVRPHELGSCSSWARQHRPKSCGARA